jgi:flagellar biosynthesis protein FliP
LIILRKNIEPTEYTLQKPHTFAHFRQRPTWHKALLAVALFVLVVVAFRIPAHAAPLIELPEERSEEIQLLILLTILSLVPSILIMMTGFTRIIIVLTFVRNALGLQQTPPNQVLIGLAIILNFFFMAPVIDEIKTVAYTPYINEQITQEEAIDNGMVPLREFMLKQTYRRDLDLFMEMARLESVPTVEEIPDKVVISAFVTSELKRAFQIGFFIFIPFLVIDMIVASTLMAMGMMMLPPTVISLPFKILLFVLVDGWGLVIKTLFNSFA